MTAKYHINPNTGRVNICQAKKQCKFTDNQGNIPPHFDSKEAAKAFQEKELVEKYGAFKKVSRKKPQQELSVQKVRVSKTVTSPTQTETDTIIQEMFKENQKMESEVSKKEYLALYAYAGNAYETINKTLRGNITDSDRAKVSKRRGYELAPERIELIDKAMKSHGYGHEPKTVYRYIRLDKKQDPQEFIQNNMNEGQEIEEKGYMSTSEDLAFVIGHVNDRRDKNNYIVLEITTDKGISLQDKDEEQLGKIQSFEKERLLPRDMKLTVESHSYQKLEIDESREKIIEEFTRGTSETTIQPQNVYVVKMTDSNM